MRAAKEKMVQLFVVLIYIRMINELVRQLAATQAKNHVYDEIETRNSEKPPIGTSEKIRPIVPVENNQQPRKYVGENVVHLRRLHWAPEMSLYRAYFLPNGIDPDGAMVVSAGQAEEKSPCEPDQGPICAIGLVGQIVCFYGVPHIGGPPAGTTLTLRPIPWYEGKVVLFGEPIDEGELPEFQDEKEPGGCKCDMVPGGNIVYPPGGVPEVIGGHYVDVGKNCKLGKQVIKKYPAVCKQLGDKECTSKCCNKFYKFTCVKRKRPKLGVSTDWRMEYLGASKCKVKEDCP